MTKEKCWNLEKSLTVCVVYVCVFQTTSNQGSGKFEKLLEVSKAIGICLKKSDLKILITSRYFFCNVSKSCSKCEKFKNVPERYRKWGYLKQVSSRN